MTEQEKYYLSTYVPVELLQKTDSAAVELVQCSLDGRQYVKKTYPEDKREIFGKLSQIHSPHIPAISGVFFGTDTIVIEEYIPGKTLQQLLQEGHRFSKTEVRQILDGLLNAVGTLHENDLIHRDIKPSNILLRPDGSAVLIDYSIARTYCKAQTADTELLGTVGYAAPEQYGFSQSDHKTDIYALGVTMKQLLTGKNAPKFLRRAMDRCTEFDPSRRFPSIKQLRTALKRNARIPRYTAAAAAAIVLCLLGLCTANWIAERKAANLSPIVYDCSGVRLVNTLHCGDTIACLPMEEDGCYNTEITLSDTLKNVPITAIRDGGTCEVTVNGTTFTFVDDGTMPTVDYPSGTPYAELLFYDLNSDGVLDILPIVSNALKTQWLDGTIVMLRNYSLGWCVYHNGTDFVPAEGMMIAELEPFMLYETTPGLLWTDFPEYYTLTDGVLIRGQ